MAYTNSSLVTYKRLTTKHSGKRTHKIDTITIHVIVGQWTAKQGCDYFATTDRNASCNYVVGKDGSIGLCVEEKNRSWCSSNSANDNRAITIEVASDTKHPYAVTNAAYDALIRLCADICKRNDIKELKWKGDKSLIGQVDKQNMTVHRWFSPTKACPGDYLYNKHGEIAKEVNAILGSSENYTTEEDKKTVFYRVGKSWSNGRCVGQIAAFTNKDNAIKKAKENNTWKVFDDDGKVVYEYEVTKPVAPTKINVTYSVQVEGGKILPAVKNLEDYAGIENKKITGIAMKVDKGTIKYQVHVLGGGWLDWVTGYNWKDHNNGYAGNGKPIDAIRVYYSTPSDLTKKGDYREAKYHVSTIGNTKYYSWQLDDTVNKAKDMDGYAGAFGKAIDKVQIDII